MRHFSACLLFSALMMPLGAQTPATSEINTKDAPVIFRSATTVVPVTVVVRNASGNAVGNLTVDDFRLLDEGKPQRISKFAVEKFERPAAGTVSKAAVAVPGEIAEATTDGIPDRFVSYLFDDQHLGAADLINVRQAARKHIAQLDPLTRAAVYSTSGTIMLEFTADRVKLESALLSLQARAGSGRETSDCPPMDYYFADLIDRRNDIAAFNIAVQDTIVCSQITDTELAGHMVKATARNVASIGMNDTRASLQTMSAIVRRMAAMPGQRMIVLVSPGFYVTSETSEAESELVERAVRSNVVVNAINARGLYTRIPGGDVSQRTVNIATQTEKARYLTAADVEMEMTMAAVASGTGGTLTENSNDMEEGFRRAAVAPEYIYILNFSPQEMKFDGKYHNLKVSLVTAKGLAVQARRGYYAPRKAADPAEMRRQEMEETLFSRDELHDLPVTVQTQFFKMSAAEARLSVIAKIDVRKLPFHRENERNRSDLTILSCLFDDNGNYVTGLQKNVELRLLDATLATKLTNGMGVRNDYTVKPGKYMVRLVVRDSEGETMAAQTSIVEIP